MLLIERHLYLSAMKNTESELNYPGDITCEQVEPIRELLESTKKTDKACNSRLVGSLQWSPLCPEKRMSMAFSAQRIFEMENRLRLLLQVERSE